MPEGLNTVVDECGIQLFGVQRQRIGITLALYHNHTVLVSDKAISVSDSIAGAGVMGVLHALHGTETINIVTHRLAKVEHCNWICRL